MSASERGSGSTRSSSGRAAQTTTRPAGSATFVLNSFVWGAISRVLAIATRSPKTIRPTWPVGTVFGSVIMKNRKMRTSGEVTMTRQKSVPQTGENAQFATMQWPETARTPMPIASDTQNVAARPSSRSRPVIITGGLLITRRLRLLGLAATFWVSLAIGMGVLAVSGHCMVANWAFSPVCGTDFWRVIVTSPEVLIFLFFMITDPKTVPTGRVGRIVFGLLVAIASTLLIAPQTTEFNTKVALLAGLVVICAARPLLDRLLPEPRSGADEVGRFARRLTFGDGGRGALRGAVGVALTLAAVLVLGVGIVAAGSPARGVVSAGTGEVLDTVPHAIDPGTLPAIAVDVPAWDDSTKASIAQGILVVLAENLELENQALLRRDPTILTAVDHGDRLAEMQGRLRDAEATGTTVIEHYAFDDVRVVVIAPFGVQSGGSIGFVSRGTVTRETYDKTNSLVDRHAEPFDRVFAVRRPTGERWMNVGDLPPGAAQGGSLDP